MAATSMFETIMELPLFKGIGEEQLSLLLEKTSIEFLKFDDGESICKKDDPVSSVDFILSGRVKQNFKLENFDIEVNEILGKGSVINALQLYGLTTNSICSSTAIGKVSIMRISKSQYMNILLSDRIYILNFVNYLAANAQKSSIHIMGNQNSSIRRTLENLVLPLVARTSETIMLAGDDSEIARYCGVSDDAFQEWKTAELARNRIMSNPRGIILKSPHLNP